MKAFFPDKIRQYDFKQLLLAVSGGLDSICLAHYFIENRETLGIEWLGIAHVHHGLRVGTADRDAAFVKVFAKSHNVPFFLKKLDGEALKSADGSLEENARDARYKALAEIAKTIQLKGMDSRLRENDAERAFTKMAAQDDSSLVFRLSSLVSHTPLVIVTAHHAGDQAETMLMRLRRGTTLAGLRGIQATRSLSNVTLEALRADRVLQALDPIASARLQDDITVFRPFMNVTRAELLAYARKNKLTWCEDESNSDIKFARNRVRHETLPKLEQEYPGATEQLCRIAGLANRAYEKVMDACNALFECVMTDRDCFGLCPRNDRSLDSSTSPIALCSRTLCAPGSAQDDTSRASSLEPRTSITLDKKKLRKELVAHADTDLSEMFRLWLAEKGFRFPIGFFSDAREPAHIKIPHRTVYRKRTIIKIGHTVQICEFSTPEEALNFVSCDKKDKGL